MNIELVNNIFNFLFSIIFKNPQHNITQTFLNKKTKAQDKKLKQKISVLKHLSKKFS